MVENIAKRMLWIIFLSIHFVVHSQPTFPSLPAGDFTLRVEANLLDRKETHYISEFYDYTHNRVAIRTDNDENSQFLLYDYNVLKLFTVSNGLNCSVTDIDIRRDSYFNASSNTIISYSSFINRDHASKAVYIGTEYARGILTDVWRVDEVINGSNSLYNISLMYNFVNNTWKLPGKIPGTPIQIQLQGSILAQNLTVLFKFQHFYQYYDFSLAPIVADYFLLPAQAHCPSPFPRSLPSLPLDFTAFVEHNTPYSNLSYRYTLYHDATGNRIKFQHDASDYKTSDYFFYDQLLHLTTVNDNTCSVSSISPNDIRYDNTTGKLRTNRFNFLLPNLNSLEWRYSNIKQHGRSILCDVWTADITDTNLGPLAHYSVDWYFSVAEWSSIAANPNPDYANITQFPVLIRIHGSYLPSNANDTEKFFMEEYHFVNFIVGRPDPLIFLLPPSTQCKNPNPKPFPSFPILDNDFVVTIEASFEELGISSNAVQYTSPAQRKIRVDRFEVNSSHIDIVSLDTRTIQTITKNNNCTTYRFQVPVRNTSQSAPDPHTNLDRFLFRTILGPGEQFLFFHWETLNFSYFGTRIVFGKHCDVWSSFYTGSTFGPYNLSNTNTGVKVEFVVTSDVAWSTPNNKVLPVSFNVFSFPLSNQAPAGIYFYHSYNFVNFVLDMLSPDVFIPPDPIRCPVSVVSIPIPDLPKQYSVNLEANIRDFGFTLNLVEIYDQISNRVRIDRFMDSITVTTIYDYNTFLRHSLRNTSNGYVCNTTVLSKNDSRYNPTTGRLDDLDFDYLLSGLHVHQYPFSYIGPRVVRGINAELWSTTSNYLISDFRNGTILTTNIDWYFSSSSWSIRSHNRISQLPLRVVISGNRIVDGKNNGTVSRVFDYSNFAVETPNPSLFFSCADYLSISVSTVSCGNTLNKGEIAGLSIGIILGTTLLVSVITAIAVQRKSKRKENFDKMKDDVVL